MKKLLCILIFCLIPCLAYSLVSASPFIVCDPQAGVTEYRVTGAEWVPTAGLPAEADGSIKMDVSMAPVGQSSLFFQACNVDPVWGVQCSISSPFGFSRPTTPALPATLRLTPYSGSGGCGRVNRMVQGLCN